MKRRKLWQRTLAGLLSASMVVANLPVTELVARAEESELLVLDDGGGDVVLPEDEPVEADVFTELPGTDLSSGGLEVEGIEELPGVTEWTESESESESESETESESEKGFETENAAENTSSGAVFDSELESELSVTEAMVPEELITEAQWETELLAEGMELLAVEEAEVGSGETANDAAGGAEPAAGDSTEAGDVTVLTAGTSAAVEIAQEGEVKWFSFTPDRSGTYCFRSTGRYDTLARLYADRAGEPLAEADDSGSQYDKDSNFKLSYTLEAGQTYYLAAQMCYEYVTGAFEVCVGWENYAIQSIQFTPKLTYYYPLDSEYIGGYTRDVPVDVVYTDGKEEHFVGSSSYTGQSVHLSWDSNVKTDGHNYIKPGTWGATVSYLTEQYSYQIEVLPASRVAAFPESGIVEGSEKTMPWYRVTPEESGYYLLSRKSVIGSADLMVRSATGATVSPFFMRSNYWSGDIAEDSLYWMEAGQDYFVSGWFTEDASQKWSVSLSRLEDLPQNSTADGSKEYNYYIYHAEQDAALALEVSASHHVDIEVYRIDLENGNETLVRNASGKWVDEDTCLVSCTANTVQGQAYLIVLEDESESTSGYTLVSSLNPYATGIQIVQNPKKLSYTEGETLTPAGLSVLVTYADGTSRTISYGEGNELKVEADASAYLEGFGFLKAGTHTVTVSYGSCKTEYTITVTAGELSLTDREPVSVTIPAGGSGGYWTKYYTFIPSQTGFYTISLTGENLLSNYINLFDSQGKVVVSGYDKSYLLGEGRQYKVQIQIESQDTGTETTAELSAALDGRVNLLETGGSYTVTEARWFSFTPSEAGQYMIYSDNDTGDADPCVSLYTVNDGRIAYTRYGGEGSNFRLSRWLDAGVTYFYKAESYYSFSAGSFEVHFEKQQNASSVRIIKYPRQSYCERIDQDIDYDGLSVEVTYEDKTVEEIRYEYSSQISGDSLQIREPEGLYDSAGQLVAGEYTITVAYMGLSAEYQVTVKKFNEVADALEEDKEKRGTVAEGLVNYWSFTPSEDGNYTVMAAAESTTPSVTVTEPGGGNLSPLGYRSDYWYENSTNYYSYSAVYSLKAGITYCITTKGSAQGDVCRLMASKVAGITPGGSIQVTGMGYRFAELSVEKEGFYRLDLQGSADIDYLEIADSFSSYNSYSRYYTDVDSETGMNYGLAVAYLERGEYAVRFSFENGSGTMTFAACGDSETVPKTFDTQETSGLHWDCRVVTPSDTASYVLQMKRSEYHYYYNNIAVFDQDTVQVSGNIEDSSSDGTYTWTTGADLTAGENYLIVSLAKGATSLSVEKASGVSLTVLEQSPRTTYYYKVEKVNQYTDLSRYSSLKIQYTDGTEEVLEAGNISPVTGHKYSISLPADAKYDSAGYLKPGTYHADVTYLGHTIQIPITVKTAAEIPSFSLDESGAGSYTGTPEEGNKGYGFVRFRALEDGFYDLTLSAAKKCDIEYNGILNAAYGSMSINSKSEYSDTRKLSHVSIYVKRGQSCYVGYLSREEKEEVTLSVSRAANQTIGALSCGVREEAVSSSSSGAAWYSFTPEETGTYNISTQDAGAYTYPALMLYASPDDANYLTCSYYTINGYNRHLSYLMTAGTTYYVKLSGFTGTMGLTVVKEAKTKSLELVTEGEIYCSSLPDYIESSFENLQFRITYEDGTQEEMPFGYRIGSSSGEYTSLQGKTISYRDPDWEYDENGNIVDKEYIVRFIYDGKYVDVPVTARSIQELTEAGADFTTAIAAGKYSYYKFTPATSGFYRFTAKADAVCPSVDMFDPYMKLMSSDYSNSYSDDGQHQVKVYELTAGQEYCLRLGNSGTVEQSVTCSNEMLSPATSIEITAQPQTVYYLGVDSQYSEDGLEIQVTYEDGTTETLAAGKPSTITGLAVETKLSGNDEGNKYLGSTGTKTVYVTYMDASASYSINVLDSSGIQEMTVAAPYTGTLASARDDVYVKYIADATGFYRVSLAGGESLTPEISAVKNSSYADQVMKYEALTQQDGISVKQCLVYMLAGKAYYLKGHLLQDGVRAAGSYTASVQQLEDLRDGVLMNTLAAGATGLCQFTAKETGYYQFTLDAAEDVALKLYNSGYGALSTETGTRGDRKYYIVRLQAGAVYLAVITNGSEAEQAYTLHAGSKAEVTKLTIAQQPSRLTYYAQFENSISGDGLVLHIEYADKTSEELAFGQRSTWGVRMSLDMSAVKKDAKGSFVAGTYQIDCCYLEKKASYTIDVVDFDVENAQALTAESLTEIEVPVGESVFYTFTPELTQTYHFYSRGDAVVDAYIYEADGTLVAMDGGGNGFSITTELTGGKQYILRVNAPAAKEAVTATIKLHDTSASVEVSSITLSENELVFGGIGETKTLTATVKPEDAADRSVSWSSDNEAVATVSADGTVTSVAPGEAVITASTTDCGYTADCRVMVDLEAPEITEAYPADQAVLGPTARTLYVYAHDNTGISSLEVSYKKSTDADSKTLTVAAEETDVPDTVITAELPLDGFADGDTITVSLTVTDRGGHRSEAVTRTYTVDMAAPELSDLAGAYNETTLAVDLSWKGMMEQDISSYNIYRKVKDADDSTYKYLGFETGYVNKADYSYTDATVENQDAEYTYRVKALDKRGNDRDYTVDVRTWLVDQAPVASLNCASTMVSGKSYPFDLTGSTDDGKITAITIDYGDGTSDQASSAAEAKFDHTYTLAEGETEKKYPVSVTVTDDMNQSTSLTKTIRVVNLDSVGMLTVHVVDTDGIPLAGAPVYFNMGEEGQVITETDRQGVAEFTDVPGFYAVGTYVTGYLPYKTSVEVVLGETKELTITLEEKELVETSIETHRMTLDEIRDVEEKTGISFTKDQDNYHVVKYMVTLEYSTINIYSDGANAYVEGEGEGWIPVAVSDEIIVILKIPVGVSMLKEFYNVKMYIVNNASEEFSLLQNHVTLHVPEGLTVMEEAANGTEVDIDAIPGQTTEIVEWILRGDKSGEYDLSADYTGVLSDFNAPLSATCRTDEKLKVYGVDNLGVSMEIPDQFTNGEFFYSLTMENTAEVGNDAADMYLPGLTGEGELIQTVLYKEDGTKEYVTVLPEVLHAGERIERFYRITDQISEQLAQYPDYKDFVFCFRNMWVEELTSYGVPLDVEVVPAAELMALYEQYRALPAEDVTVEASGTIEYGYAEGDVKLKASATAAANAEYTLTYEWYDTRYNKLGEGQEFIVQAGLTPGAYHYHCVVVSTRTDNGNKAQTQYQDILLTVEPKTVTLSWAGNEERVYDGTASNVTAAAGELLEGDICTVKVIGGDAVDAGTHTATAESLSNEFYRLPAENTCEYVITAKEVTLTWKGNEERVYDGKASEVAAEVSEDSLAEGDTCTVKVTGGDAKDAGTHTATATELDNANYRLPAAVQPAVYALAEGAESGGADAELPTAVSTLMCEYVITPKEAELAWSGVQTRAYDGTASAAAAAVANLVEGDACKVTVTGGDAKNAGAYTATATELDNGNYKLPADVDCPYEITPRVAELGWTGADSRTYTGASSEVKAEVANLVEGDTCAVTVTGGNAKDAGTHTATAETLDNANYTLPTEKTCEYVIEPKEVTLKWSGTEQRVYDGTASAVTAAAEGMIEGDTCSVTVSGGDAKDAGTHTAAAAELSNTNYRLPAEKTCTYVIGPKTISLIWSGAEDRSYNGTASAVTAKAEGLIGADTCTVTVTGGDAKDAGTHTATAAALGNGNYALPQDAACTYKIKPLEAQLEWIGAKTKEYDGAAFHMQAQVKNLIAGDTCAVTVTGGDEKVVGTYTATATALGNPNYLLPAEAGTLSQTYEITPRTAVIRWTEAGTREYDGASSKVQAEVANLAAGDTCAVTVSGGDAAAVGTHTATVTGLGNSNYKLPADAAALRCEYVISQRTAQLTWTGVATRAYDGNASNVQAVVGNLLPGDTCAVTVTGGNGKDAGTYTAAATALSNANYVLPANASASYTISKAAQTISATETVQTVAVGKSMQLASVLSGIGTLSYAGSNSKIATVGATGAVKGKKTGKITVTVTAAGDDNYEQAVLKLTIIVVPKRSTAKKVTSPAKRSVKVTWKKVTGASGYQIQVSTSKKFKKSKTKSTTAGSKATSKTIRKLKSRKTYYVRIRAYKKINGKKYYGRFSKIRKIRVK